VERVRPTTHLRQRARADWPPNSSCSCGNTLSPRQRPRRRGSFFFPRRLQHQTSLYSFVFLHSSCTSLGLAQQAACEGDRAAPMRTPPPAWAPRRCIRHGTGQSADYPERPSASGSNTRICVWARPLMWIFSHSRPHQPKNPIRSFSRESAGSLGAVPRIHQATPSSLYGHLLRYYTYVLDGEN
jgi:hypothetical protein